MRIMFRGKEAESGKWLYGWVLGEKTKSIIELDTQYVSKEGVEAYYISVVIPETVGQYTGLDDKNGKKIFEGDVCKLILNKVFVELTSGSFKSRRVDKNDVFFPVCEFTVNQCHPEVIGNIHDNPELMEVRE